MSTAPGYYAAPDSLPGGVQTEDANKPKTVKIEQITIYGHSNLLYWWPVWLVSFILGVVTYMDGHKMAVVPAGTVVERGQTVPGVGGPRDILVAPEGGTFSLVQEEGGPRTPGLTVSSNNSLGVVFVATLVLVALTSTILFRGLVSLVVVVLLITATVTLALFDLWNPILAYIGGLDIRMNAAGYLAIAIPLFLAWLAVVFVYDKQVYMVFDSGQIRYVLDVGDSEVVMPADGAVVEKKRNDVFRHVLLGFGTGDLLIRTGGGNGPAILLENVVNISRKLVIVNQMLKEKSVTVETA